MNEEEKTNRQNSNSLVDAVEIVPKRKQRRISRIIELTEQRKLKLL